MYFARRRNTFSAWLPLLVSFAGTVRGEQLAMMAYSVRDGVPPHVGRIVVDSKGFVWFPSRDGLVRFDGNGFSVLTEADGLPNSGASDIFERNDETYWVAAGEQLCRFDPRPGRQRFRCESPRLGIIRAVLEDDGTLWCGTDSGLWRRSADGAQPWIFEQAIKAGPSGRSSVYRLLQDDRGDVWVTTTSGAYRFRSNGSVDRWPPDRGFLAYFTTALSETPGAIWVGAQSSLFKFEIDPATDETRIVQRFDRSDGLPSGYATDVRQWRGITYVATSQGLARQSPSGRWQPVGLDPSMDGLPLQSLAPDRLGNLWVGSDGGGAARILGSGISSFSEREGLGIRKVSAVFEDRHGELIAVTKDEDHYFLNRFDGNRFHTIRPKFPSGLEPGWSWSQIVVNSRSGDWWLATASGLLQFGSGLDNAPRLQGPRVGLPAGNVFRIFEDSGGGIWASISAIPSHALLRREPSTGAFERFDSSHGLPSLQDPTNSPAAFAEDASGQIWIGMLDGGLVRFRNGRFEQVQSRSGVPSHGIGALLVDSQGRLWIGTRADGLLRLDDPLADRPVFARYTRSDGLSSNNVSALAEDLNGRMYAASGGGVDRLDPPTGRIRPLTMADGLPPGEYRVGFRDRRGALWFGGDHGLTRIEPQEDRLDAPVVLIHSIRVNGKSWPISYLGEVEPAALSLSSSERQVQVDFGGLRHDLHYQTLLSGSDFGWTSASNARGVHYLSLAPGGYELWIRAITPEGVLSSQPARVRFQIAPPVWRRWWFLLLSTAAVAGLAYAAHRYRLAQALSIERLRTRIASDLHDDIGAGLSRIVVLSEVARHEAGANASAVTQRLEVIARASRELVDSMSDIVWVINPERDRLSDLVQRVRRFASDVFTSIGVEFSFQAPSDELNSKIRADVRRHLYLICKESVHNIARHSRCSSAEVDLRVEEGWLLLTVKDNGRGFDPAQIDEGNGLVNMRKRAAILGGQFRVESGPGLGTKITVAAPLEAKMRERRGRFSGSSPR